MSKTANAVKNGASNNTLRAEGASNNTVMPADLTDRVLSALAREKAAQQALSKFRSAVGTWQEEAAWKAYEKARDAATCDAVK